MLRDRDQQYIAHRDETTHTWRILDSWHETLSNYDVDDDVADDSPAIKILTEGEFIVLIREAARIGMLENANLGGDEVEPTDFSIVSEEQTERIEELEKACEMYKVQLQDAQQQEWEATAHIDTLEKQLETSEGFKLKEMAMTSILKLTAMSDVDKLGRD